MGYNAATKRGSMDLCFEAERFDVPVEASCETRETTGATPEHKTGQKARSFGQVSGTGVLQMEALKRQNACAKPLITLCAVRGAGRVRGVHLTARADLEVAHGHRRACDRRTRLERASSKL